MSIIINQALTLRALGALASVCVLFISLATRANGCAGASYEWERVSAAAQYPTGYNYPVFKVGNEMFAVRDVSWKSADGVSWRRSNLRNSGMNSAFQKYVMFKGAVYALGTMSGNSESMTLSSRIQRTRDGETWETVAEKSSLPERVFYGATVFHDKIWIFGGQFGGRGFSDVWSSTDAVNWTKEGDKMPWNGGDGLNAIVFRDRIFLIGQEKVWSSSNGIEWRLETAKMARNPVFISGYSAAVFDDKIWLVGINRNGTFQSGVLCSDDGRSWSESSAPWSARGAVAVWVANDSLYMTGGKSSYVENGETKFVYSNDIWKVNRARRMSAMRIGLEARLD